MAAEPARAPTPRAAHAEAWTTFWHEQGPDSRCLAHLGPDLRRRLDGHWAGFAAALPPAARILDLGAGAGIVGRALLAARPDLRITGIDAAAIPAPADPRLALLARTQMESLPFGPASFDGAVSRFGVEYGDGPRVARELARVLVPGAPFSFLVHHRGSTIVRDGQARARALDQLLGEAARRSFLVGDAPALEGQLWAARRFAPADPILAPLAHALRIGIGRSAGQRAAIWHSLLAAVAPERELIEALDAACVSPDMVDGWLAPFIRSFGVAAAAPFHRAAGEPVAWAVQGARIAMATPVRVPAAIGPA